jgi:hypothetical protein
MSNVDQSRYMRPNQPVLTVTMHGRRIARVYTLLTWIVALFPHRSDVNPLLYRLLSCIAPN